MAEKYMVKKGDTLSAIAKKYGTTVSKLAKANAIQNPDVIHTGQLLIIPSDTDYVSLGKQVEKVVKDIENLPSFRKLREMM